MSARVRVPVTLSLIKQAGSDESRAAPRTDVSTQATLSEATPETVAQLVEALKDSAGWLFEQVDLIAGLHGRMTQVSVEILEAACAQYRAVGEPARVFLAGLPVRELLAGLTLLNDRQAAEQHSAVPTLSIHQGGRE